MSLNSYRYFIPANDISGNGTHSDLDDSGVAFTYLVLSRSLYNARSFSNLNRMLGFKTANAGVGLVLALLLSVQVNAHIALWDEGMYG